MQKMQSFDQFVDTEDLFTPKRNNCETFPKSLTNYLCSGFAACWSTPPPGQVTSSSPGQVIILWAGIVSLGIAGVAATPLGIGGLSPC